ncbi:MAG: hypothetical protein KBC26_01920 [Candidatus Pacebacteria bacterium]|nr:hypothetical protein [Candidatus Paceibacterota bacterium]
MMKTKADIIRMIVVVWAMLAATSAQAASSVTASTTYVEFGFPSFASATNPADFVNKIYIYALGVAGALAIIRIVYGGLMVVFNQGAPAKLADARKIIEEAIIGILLLFGAYLILNTINPGLTQLKVKPGDLSTGVNQTPATGGDDAAVRQRLQAGGVEAKPQCQEGQTTGCTLLGGLKQSIINEIINLKQNCQGSGCEVFITSGTEGNHSIGVCSHQNGWKVDLRLNESLKQYIEGNFTYVGIRPSDGAKKYKNPSTGAIYALEGDHWDVLSGGCL